MTGPEFTLYVIQHADPIDICGLIFFGTMLFVVWVLGLVISSWSLYRMLVNLFKKVKEMTVGLMNKKPGDLTGAKRHRTDWRGRMILQVQVYSATVNGDALPSKTHWRDAKLTDFPEKTAS